MTIEFCIDNVGAYYTAILIEVLDRYKTLGGIVPKEIDRQIEIALYEDYFRRQNLERKVQNAKNDFDSFIAVKYGYPLTLNAKTMSNSWKRLLDQDILAQAITELGYTIKQYSADHS